MSTATTKPAVDRVEAYSAQEVMRTGRDVTLSTSDYIAQCWGQQGRRLTPRQRRRIKQKSKHTAVIKDGRYQERTFTAVPLEVVAEPDEITELLDTNPWDEKPPRPCGGTEYCVTGSGAKARSTHVKCKAA